MASGDSVGFLLKSMVPEGQNDQNEVTYRLVDRLGGVAINGMASYRYTLPDERYTTTGAT